VCKSCHESIHGHGVGGSGSANSSTGTDDVDPVAAGVSIILVVGIAFLALTYGAVTQVLPAGQATSEDYSISYASVTEDPNGYGREYNYNAGPPLELQLALADNVISQKGTTQLTVRLHNPSDIHLDGAVDVRRTTSYYASSTLLTLSFDLAPGETTVANTTVAGEEMIAEFGSYPYTARFNAETIIYTDSYRAISTSETAGYGDEMHLSIRKPLLNRFGLYWLMLLLAGAVVAVYVWRRK